MTATTAPAYEFDEEFQTKIAALALRDPDFNARTEGLIEPGYFANAAQATLVSIQTEFYAQYRACPSLASLGNILRDKIAKGQIRKDMVGEVKTALADILKADISDKNYVIDEAAKFARHQAIVRAMEKSLPLLDKRDFGTIEKEMSAALRVGALEEGDVIDVWADIGARTASRAALLAGTAAPRGVTTGIAQLDACLQHGGWGYAELSSLMAPAKMGKSFGLMNFGVNASLAGFNVLHVSLENSNAITADRIDSYASGVKTKELKNHHAAVETAVKSVAATAGAYKLHRFPAMSFRPRDLRRLVESYRAKGLIFHLLVLDYADIMSPDVKARDNTIEDSKNVYLGVRDICVEYNLAGLTATQTNRDGAKAHTATAIHVAEDFNRIRICDLVISINRDDDEKAKGEARLYFAAGRNQEDGYTIRIKQDLSTGRFIEKVLGISRS